MSDLAVSGAFYEEFLQLERLETPFGPPDGNWIEVNDAGHPPG